MYRGKQILLPVILGFIFAANSANAAEPKKVNRRPAQASPAQPSPAAGAVPARAVRSLSKNEIGLAYTMWNERFDVAKSGVAQHGYAGFAGFMAVLDHSWTKFRWQYGLNLSFGVGKASAGGLSGALPEGRDRAWYAASVAPYFNYRLNLNFGVGLGAMARYRAIDWTSVDPNTKIDAGSRLQYAAQVNFRWALGRWTLIQSFSPLDFIGDSMWTWTAQYAL